jgi:hypothetical protein
MIETWQLSVWFAAILALMFSAGCTVGFTYARNKQGKRAAHAHSRKR